MRKERLILAGIGFGIWTFIWYLSGFDFNARGEPLGVWFLFGGVIAAFIYFIGDGGK